MATAPGTVGRTHRLHGFRCRTRPAAGSRRGVTAAAYALLSLFLHMMLRLGSLPFARLCAAREREVFAYLPRFHPSNDLSTLLPAQAPEPDSSTASSSRTPTSPSGSKPWVQPHPTPGPRTVLSGSLGRGVRLPRRRQEHRREGPWRGGRRDPPHGALGSAGLARARHRHDAQAQSHGRD